MKLSEQAQAHALLVLKKRDTKALAEELSGEVTASETALLARMADEGVASLKVETDEGRFTLSPRRELWSSCVAGHEEELNNGLRALGYSDLIRETVNSQRLSSLIREYDQTGTEIPIEIKDAVKVSEVFKIGVRKA